MVGFAETFQNNYNPFIPAGSASGGRNIMLEAPLRVDLLHGGDIQPWLAKSYKFSDDGKSVTLNLRDDVKWSDGTKLTSADFVYSLMVPIKNPQLNLTGVNYTSVEAEGDYSVKVDWDVLAYSRLSQLATDAPIVPEHVWKDVDPVTFRNSDPVVTGPYTVSNVTPQLVSLKARTDYWGGQVPVKELDFVPNNAANAQARITKDEIDWSFLATDVKGYVSSNPDTHHAVLQPDGSMVAVLFNMDQAPYNELPVRQAIQNAINADDLRKVAFANQPKPFDLANPVGLNSQVASDYIADKFKGLTQKQDSSKAKKLLADAGVTIADGKLVKDGKSFPLTLTYERGNAYWNLDGVANLIRQQLKDNLGIDVALDGLTAAARQDSMTKGNFGMALSYPGAGRGPYATYSALVGASTKPIGEAAATNFGRFNNADFDLLQQKLGSTIDKTAQKPILAEMEQIVFDQVPEIPLYNYGGVLLVNSTHWDGWPLDSTANYVPSPGIGPDMTLTILGLTPKK